jgi:hypothetical protein
LSSSNASSIPVLAENSTINPDVLGRPILGLSKKPGEILIAKLSIPGTKAVLTSTSPLNGAIAIDRIGGITTSPARQRREGPFDAVHSLEIERHEAAQVRLGEDLDITHVQRASLRDVDILAGDDPVMLLHVDVAAAQNQPHRPAGLDLARQQRCHADRTRSFDNLAFLPIDVPDRSRDVGLGDQNEIVDQSLCHGESVAVVEADTPAQGIGEVGSSSTITGLPALRLACIAAPRSIEMPMILACGLRAFTAAATPEIRPPPGHRHKNRLDSGS